MHILLAILMQLYLNFLNLFPSIFVVLKCLWFYVAISIKMKLLLLLHFDIFSFLFLSKKKKKTKKKQQSSISLYFIFGTVTSKIQVIAIENESCLVPSKEKPPKHYFSRFIGRQKEQSQSENMNEFWKPTQGHWVLNTILIAL